MSYIKNIRKQVGSVRIFAPGVRAVVVNAQNELLLQRRTDSDRWGLPGGAVELDETAYEALLREVKEETTLKVVSAEPIGLYSGLKQRFEYPNGDKIQCFALAFLVTQWEGQPQADGKEGYEVKFFPLDQLPDNVVPIHQETIRDYMNYTGKFIFS